MRFFIKVCHSIEQSSKYCGFRRLDGVVFSHWVQVLASLGCLMVHLCLGISEYGQFLMLSSLNHNRYAWLPKTNGERLFLNVLL